MSYRQITDFGGAINNVSNDPLTYCIPDLLNSQFLHGASGRTFGKYNRACAEYMSNRCAASWDGICEAASTNTVDYYPNMAGTGHGDTSACSSRRLTQGELLIKDTAYKKYLYRSFGCKIQCEPFDPTVANSPSVCYLTDTTFSTGDTKVTETAILQGRKLIPITGIQCGAPGSGAHCGQNTPAIAQNAAPQITFSDGPCRKEYGLTDEQIAALDIDPVMNKLIENTCIAPELLVAIYHTLRRQGKLSLIEHTRLGNYYKVNNLPL